MPPLPVPTHAEAVEHARTLINAIDAFRHTAPESDGLRALVDSLFTIGQRHLQWYDSREQVPAPAIAEAIDSNDDAMFHAVHGVIAPILAITPPVCCSCGHRDHVVTCDDGTEVCGHCAADGGTGELGEIAADSTAYEIIAALNKALAKKARPAPAGDNERMQSLADRIGLGDVEQRAQQREKGKK